MELGIPKTPQAMLLNKQLMYETEKFVIKPITPLARRILVSHWTAALEDTLSHSEPTGTEL